jgi:hypothetical protein
MTTMTGNDNHYDLLCIVFLIIFDNKNKNYKILKAENKKMMDALKNVYITKKTA